MYRVETKPKKPPDRVPRAKLTEAYDVPKQNASFHEQTTLFENEIKVRTIARCEYRTDMSYCICNVSRHS